MNIKIKVLDAAGFDKFIADYHEAGGCYLE